MRVLYLLSLQPLDEKREVVRNLLSVEDSVYHVTTKQTHLYLVTSVRVDLTVLVNRLKNVRRCRTIRKLQLVESALIHCQLITLLEVLYRHILQHDRYLAVSILEHQMGLHVLLLHLRHELFVLRSLGTLQPLTRFYLGLSQTIRHLSRSQVMDEGVRKEDVCLEEVKLSCQALGVGQIGSVIIEEFCSAFFQVLNLTYFKVNLF